jgi:hypothetical protein
MGRGGLHGDGRGVARDTRDGVLLRRLAGKDARGQFVVRRFDATGRGATRDGDVAWRTIAAMYSPNALPIDVDADEGIALFHDLVVHRPSEEPA